MRVAFAVLAGILAFCGAGLSSSAAKAEWSGWYPITYHAQIVGEPSIVHFGKGASYVAVVARGEDDALWYTMGPDGITFGDWKSKGGVMISPPSCVSRDFGILDCYVRGSDSGIHQMGYDTKTWSGWIGHGGQVFSNPAAIGSIKESTVVFGISATTLFHRSWNADFGWSSWWPLHADPRFAGATLECDQSKPGKGEMYYTTYLGLFSQEKVAGPYYARDYRVLCLLRHEDNSISGYEAVIGFTAVRSSWYGALPEVPKSEYRPDVVMDGWDKAHVFVTGLDGKMRTATWESGVGFGEWVNLDGGFTSGPSCHGRDGPDYTIICAGRSLDGSVWINRLLK